MDQVLYDLKVPATEDFLRDIKKLWSTIYQRETHQAIKGKTRADKAWWQPTIQDKDLVMLIIYRLVLKAARRKLKPRFKGPFWVEAQVGANTFKLTPAATMWVHPVFNISLLRPYQGYYTPPGPIEVEAEAEYEVDKIIQNHGNGRRWQHLVQWLGYNASEDCWLRADKLQNFPVALANYIIS